MGIYEGLKGWMRVYLKDLMDRVWMGLYEGLDGQGWMGIYEGLDGQDWMGIYEGLDGQGGMGVYMKNWMDRVG